jgi:hypothetical protein
MPHLHFSYSPNYFSIEDIVLQDVRVSCKFEVAVPKLGKQALFNFKIFLSQVVVIISYNSAYHHVPDYQVTSPFF